MHQADTIWRLLFFRFPEGIRHHHYRYGQNWGTVRQPRTGLKTPVTPNYRAASWRHSAEAVAQGAIINAMVQADSTPNEATLIVGVLDCKR
jgi:hypothetical protein